MSDSESAEYPGGTGHVGTGEVDRLYDHLDENVSFFSTLQEAITVLGSMQDPSGSKLFEKIDRISREDVHKWKRSACSQALVRIDTYHPPR